MFPSQFDYHRAASVAEAVELLSSLADAKLVAGGHSLIPAMKLRAAQPAALVDIGRIPGLSDISSDGDSLVIGALATHTSVADSAAVRGGCPMLAETAAAIGDIQVRNRGTIGGSLAHADPGADYPAAMLALGAEITAVGAGGERTIAASDFFVDILTTALADNEVITSVRVPCAAGGAYLKHRHPASSYAVVGVAACVGLDGGDVASCAIGINGVTGKAVLADAAAAALCGGPASADRIAAAAACVGDAFDEPLGDLYASGEFRAHLAGVYTKRALAVAAARAG
ncbi:MAG: xanthine dehydrogenase family protein subunit M [Acidobacteria bacterium]|nr:xanthine dehydrogenase family protein subunit M [Acidobacteriota bacterium]MYF13786.1 xanthine dehydrogenase family protein subunit M [Acidobacteriota bacterium]MYI97407.1 xanthine dehydrogenase family protein subunit M [Acidobacteriota bacterium]